MQADEYQCHNALSRLLASVPDCLLADTHQRLMGLEFNRVMVLLEGEENRAFGVASF